MIGSESLAGPWRVAMRRMFFDRQLELWLGELGALDSLTEIRARVVDVIRETPDVRTFVLRPSRRWQPHRAGQWTTVEVEIDGARARRCYSISSAPGEPLVAITVKRVPGGRVSGWLHDRVRIGDVLRLDVPRGDFVLPEGPLPPLLMLSGGSGITPMMSMLRALAAREAMPDVVLVHHARRRGDVIFERAIDALAARHPTLRRVWCLDDEPGGPGGFDEARLAALVPDLEAREPFLCGPSAMMARVEAMWRREAFARPLHVERFVAAPSAPVAEGDDAPITLRLARSSRTLTARTAGTLLDQLERAGERPASGCRMGLCRTCTCTKRSGTVRHAITGAISSAPDEPIQLCVSVPCGDVELAL
ncbi:ferredoxin reductase [Sandaracinus amylolyticus]|uniref:ferredoxin reductase n=1 Tax=Sandaracinus amylolyticus TaxID=927083 RepID=UPI001F1F0AC6|nr:ferredoxin reductase [Sandaracinus amylolyticus]UJR85615.1 Hypothetical protein I5071_76950 [Sandaracinus amylolyticus]